MVPEDKSKIDELKKTLYSRNAPLIRTKRRIHVGEGNKENVKTDWEHTEEAREEVVLNETQENHTMSFFTKLFWASLIFFILAVGIGGYLVFKGSNIVSTNNIEININGPVSVSGGSPVTFDIQIHNKNNITLENVDLEITFPPGTADPHDIGTELKTIKERVDDIRPGGISQKTVGAIMYGEENSKKDIVVAISYKVKGSNASFPKQKNFEVHIASSPLSMAIDTFNEVTSGQTFKTTVTLTSNSKETLKNLLVKAVYPFGYNFISSDVKPSGDTNTWKIGDIPPGGKKVIVLTGKMEGQDDDVKVFRFTAGAQSLTNSSQIGTQYLASSREITIKKPFVTASITFEGDTGSQEYIGAFNKPIRTELTWFNNLPTSIIDGEIHARISGTAYDKLSVTPENGYYKSAENEIVWTKVTTSNLSNIPPEGTGSVYFQFTPRDASTSFKGVTNPSVTIDLSIKGTRLSESNVPEKLESSATRKIKISSSMNLNAHISRGSTPFENTGPIPPAAEKKTTYTVTLALQNTVNTLSGVRVEASLPPHVKWAGKTSPSSQDISYNSNSGKIIWNIGNVQTFTQNSPQGSRPEVSFQIILEPSVAQIGQVPILINSMQASGIDDFTGETLTSLTEALTTRSNDSDGVVVR